LAAFGRTYLSAGAGYIAHATGWVWFFVICALAGLPALLLLGWLQRRGHFDGLGPTNTSAPGKLSEPAKESAAAS
jgi:MFS transporter, PAT family, beta-lactamase induction signal transducer AmpG